jgi:DNA-binding XRE family transcriptional regulator
LAAFAFVILWTVCYCWRERSRRRSVKEIERQRYDERMQLLREYARLLSEAKLAAEDLPLIARLERIEPASEVEPPDEVEPPAAS